MTRWKNSWNFVKQCAWLLWWLFERKICKSWRSNQSDISNATRLAQANEMEIVSSSATINGRIDAILASRLYWYTFRRQLSVSPILRADRHRQQGNVSESLELFANHRQMPKPSRTQHVRFEVISLKNAFLQILHADWLLSRKRPAVFGMKPN